MNLPPMPEPPENCAWHYTSADGLLGMIRTNSVWATSAAFMNDANEMRTGVRALKKRFEILRSDLTPEDQAFVEDGSLLEESSVDDLFLVSASKHPDLLTLWRYYGGQAAYSVGFDRSIALGPRAQSPEEAHPAPPPGYEDDGWDEDFEGRRYRMYDPDAQWVFGGNWRDVLYVERDGSPAHASKILEFIEAQKAAMERGSFVVELGGFADSPINLEKDDAFKNEEELRVVIQLNPSWKYVKYRSTRFGLTPYIELAGCSNGAAITGRILTPRLPIRHIRIGPSTDPQSSRRALRGLLDDNGYGEVEVSVSGIPFR